MGSTVDPGRSGLALRAQFREAEKCDGEAMFLRWVVVIYEGKGVSV